MADENPVELGDDTFPDPEEFPSGDEFDDPDLDAVADTTDTDDTEVVD